MLLSDETVVGVVGAGTMGTGIAQVAASAGHRVIMVDADRGAVEKAQASIAATLDRLVEKKKMSREAAAAVRERIQYRWRSSERPARDFADCGLVIEAIKEDLGAKTELFRAIELEVADTCVLATNTSSLSVTSIAASCARRERVLGLHFFNPAPVLPLVEVVPWRGGDPSVLAAACALMTRWNKTPVVASDTPGFIVNRIARPFYGESIRMVEEGVADFATIDWAMKTLGKFRMGPFELMDLIGNDVNFAVTRSIFEAFFYEPRYRPSLTQQRLVEAGSLGRKSGQGYYRYGDGVAMPAPTEDSELGGRILDRVLAMLINEAVDALFLRVASARDIDLAMTTGVNYPKGLLAWADEIGLERVLDQLTRLEHEYGEDRYRSSPLLRRMVRDRATFF
ncbi:MAG TPA: 3-hydroxyacyl-CoA dehydrogenase NAD-binding domain-containing protein [Gemmatimonadaceae bacterium]|nr:3-hydroxyacyl-CoA dehydrogenase NAD-binding domain-containing protein [Gemmatimonadaceae bacterium]